LKLIVGN